MLYLWGFSTPYSTVMTINKSTQGEPWFVRKKQIFQHTKPLVWKNHVLHLIIAAKLPANNMEARKWASTERLSKCWKGPLLVLGWGWGLGKASSMLLSVMYIWSFGCFAYGTRCLKTCDIARNACSGKLYAVAIQIAAVRYCKQNTVPHVSTPATGSRKSRYTPGIPTEVTS